MIKLYRDSNFSDSVVKSVGSDDIDSLVITQFLHYQRNGSVGVIWEVDRDADNVNHITLERNNVVFFDQDVEGNEFTWNTNDALTLILTVSSPYYLSASETILLTPINKGIGAAMIFGPEIKDEDHTWFVVGGEQLKNGVGTIGYRVGSTLEIG